MATDNYRLTTTGQNMVKAALRLIGAYASGETLDTQEQTDGIESLNRMLDAWNAERLIVYHFLRQTAALTAGQQSRTVGPTGQLDIVRPQTIEQGQAYLTGGVLGANEVELTVLNQEEYGRITDKTLSATPCEIYYEPSFPLGTAWLYPTPDAAYTLILYVWQLFTQISSPTANISFPAGYADALIYNLAVRLADEFGGEVKPSVAQLATEGKARIKRMNIKPLYLSVDAALARPGRFDILTGGYR